MAEETRTGEEMVKQYEALQEVASSMARAIIEVFGSGGGAGRVYYNRDMALTKLEECMHRVNDGLHFLVMTAVDAKEKAAEAALAGKGAELKLVK